jgi:hypothetical protein
MNVLCQYRAHRSTRREYTVLTQRYLDKIEVYDPYCNKCVKVAASSSHNPQEV